MEYILSYYWILLFSKYNISIRNTKQFLRNTSIHTIYANRYINTRYTR